MKKWVFVSLNILLILILSFNLIIGFLGLGNPLISFPCAGINLLCLILLNTYLRRSIR